jgi:hypothetical protein
VSVNLLRPRSLRRSGPVFFWPRIFRGWLDSSYCSEHRGSFILYSPHRMVASIGIVLLLRGGQGTVAPAMFSTIVVTGGIGVGFGQSDIESDCSLYSF